MSERRIAVSLVRSPSHNLASHPENVARFEGLEAVLGGELSKHLVRVEAPAAAEEAVGAVHPDRYLRALEAACAQGPAYIDPAPTYVTPSSFDDALRAAGGTLAVVDAVIDGTARTGLALVRPPGHHATALQAMGFCLLNNIAIAARHAQARGLRRLMIVDFDLHHGNGTQDIFEDDGDVLYLSTHQYGIYPGSGAADEVGTGAGRGATINIPLYPHCGDQTFAAIRQEILLPAARRFAPDMLLVSAGFDGHWRDPLGQLQLTCRGYYDLVHDLATLAAEMCSGRVVAALEGGYDPEALAEGVRFVGYALAGLPAPVDPLGSGGYLEPDFRPVLGRVRQIHGL